MKYALVLIVALAATWMSWSGHVAPFMLLLGGASILLTWVVCSRMKLVDEETVPLHLLPGLIPYSIYLIREIIVSNIEVTRIILSPKMELHRNLVEVEANQKSEVGNVILANSITLTPGTVSVSMDNKKILIHALSYEGAEEELTGDMGDRVSQLEGNG